MCIWPESVASRGSDEIASCLLKAVSTIKQPHQKHLVVYSDSCFGQNKNFAINAFWLYIVNSGLFETVQHRFLLPGHTYVACDADFGVIEKKKRLTQAVYVPSQWAKLIREARKKIHFPSLK
jgi:hypothetical protein